MLTVAVVPGVVAVVPGYLNGNKDCLPRTHEITHILLSNFPSTLIEVIRINALVVGKAVDVLVFSVARVSELTNFMVVGTVVIVIRYLVPKQLNRVASSSS